MELYKLVKDWLLTNGYTGLCSDECGCELDDLMPCDEPDPTCEAAHKHYCAECPMNGDCGTQNEYGPNFVTWCMKPEKVGE